MQVDNEILSQLNSGDLVITPFDQQYLGPSSYDISIGNRYYTPNITHSTDYYNTWNSNQELWWGPVSAPFTDKRIHGLEPYQEHIILPPKGVRLATSREEVQIPDYLSALCIPRSSIYRLGLQLDTTYVDPGYKGRLTFVIHNPLNCNLVLPVGTRIAQLVFLRSEVESTNPYQGKYTSDSPLPKLESDI